MATHYVSLRVVAFLLGGAIVDEEGWESREIEELGGRIWVGDWLGYSTEEQGLKGYYWRILTPM